MEKEDNAIVLDFLPHGYAFDNTPGYKKTSIVQALGKTRLALLEAVPKKDATLQIHEEVYIGEGKRDKIHHIKEIVEKDEAKYVEFFNKAQPLSTRMHILELLPGLGKKHMWEIVEERKAEPFKSFEDLKKRVKLMPDPVKILVKRIMSELMGTEKYIIFVGR